MTPKSFFALNKPNLRLHIAKLQAKLSEINLLKGHIAAKFRQLSERPFEALLAECAIAVIDQQGIGVHTLRLTPILAIYPRTLEVFAGRLKWQGLKDAVLHPLIHKMRHQCLARSQ